MNTQEIQIENFFIDKVKEKYIAYEIFNMVIQMDIADLKKEKKQLRDKLHKKYYRKSPFIIAYTLYEIRENGYKDIELYLEEYDGEIADFFYTEEELIYYSKW